MPNRYSPGEFIPRSSGGWFDATNNIFWLYGGYTFHFGLGGFGYLSDLVKYTLDTSDLANSEWTTVQGDSTLNVEPVYPLPGNASYNATPGARYKGVQWRDAEGNLWMFGGQSKIIGVPDAVVYNDLWKYVP